MTTTQMRAVVYRSYGGPEVLHSALVPQPTPGDGELLIRIHAATVTTGDCEMRGSNHAAWIWLPLRLFLGLRRPRRPILGQELAGEVAAVGPGVSRFKTGDKVYAHTLGGAYAEYRCVSETSAVSLKPANLNFGEAAGMPTGGESALHFLRLADPQAGERVVINGAAGSIGSVALQIAKHLGCRVTAVDHGGKTEFLRQLGADEVIDYRSGDFTRMGDHYDVVFDVVGTTAISASLACLRPGGRYIIANPRLWPILKGMWTNATSDKRVIFTFASATAEDFDQLRELIEDGAVTTVIDKVFAMDEAAAAHRYVESGRRQGTVVLAVGDWQAG